ncbi:hypothetical protein EDD85DRAFT_987536 [Armillaria nabsnona]|nr:hypothetical protein EDD85DRAFT_987536 [Armillaria nabsnona]
MTTFASLSAVLLFQRLFSLLLVKPCLKRKGDTDFRQMTRILEFLCKVKTVRFQEGHIATVAPADLLNTGIQDMYLHNSTITHAAMVGLLQVFPCIRKLALVGTRSEVHDDDDDPVVPPSFAFEHNSNAVPLSFAVGDIVRKLEVLAVHFRGLPDDDVLIVKQWLSTASKLEVLSVKAVNDTDVKGAQDLMNSSTRTLKKMKLYVHDGGSWTDPLDFSMCERLEVLHLASMDYYGHMLLATFLTLKVLPHRLTFSFRICPWNYTKRHQHALQIFKDLADAVLSRMSSGENSTGIRVAVVIYLSDCDRAKDVPFSRWIEETCFKNVAETLGERFTLNVLSG